jgi:hypothetical protein
LATFGDLPIIICAKIGPLALLKVRRSQTSASRRCRSRPTAGTPAPLEREEADHAPRCCACAVTTILIIFRMVVHRQKRPRPIPVVDDKSGIRKTLLIFDRLFFG